MRVAIVVCLLAASCEKSGPKESGQLTTAESSLMTKLPANADIVFGGNFLRLQKSLASTPFAKLMSMAEAQSPGMTKWVDCFAAQNGVDMLGSVDVDKTIDMRFVMTGVKVDDLERCAKAAGFDTKVDSDRKFIAIQPANENLHYAYLVLADAVYSRQKMVSGTNPVVESLDRATLEADIAALAKSNAAQNAALQAVVAKADRSKAMWFAGTGGGTPIADKVSEGYGSLDFGNGFELDVRVAFKDSALATKIITGFDDAKSASGLLGSEVAQAIAMMKLDRSGDTLHFSVKLTTEQLDNLVNKLGKMRGGL